MACYPSPITAENFRTAWKRIARKCRWSKKKELIRRVSVWIAHMIFFFLFLILALGVFYEMGGSFVRRFMDQLPEVNLWWGKITGFLLAGASNEVERMIRCFGTLYLLPFCATLPAVLLIALLYHPITPQRTGDLEKDAWQLRGLAKHAQVYAQRKESDMAKVCSVFMGILMVAFVTGMMLFAYDDVSTRNEVVSIAHQASLRTFLYGAAVALSYRLVSIPLKWLLKLLHFCYVPQSIVTDTEQFHTQIKAQASAPADPAEG